MASRLHRIIQQHLKAHPSAAFTSVDLFTVCHPDADPTDKIARTSFSRTLRRLVLPAGWEVREPQNQRLPNIIFNAAHADSVSAADVLSGSTIPGQ